MDIDDVDTANPLASQKNLTWNSTSSSDSVSTGRTSTSPFILKGGPLSFRAEIVVPEGGVTRSVFLESLDHALLGLNPTLNPITSVGGVQSFPTTDEEWFYNHSYNLNIGNGFEFSHESDEKSDLIISFTRNSTNADGVSIG